MYIPKAFRLQDEATILSLIDAHPFATLVSVIDGEPWATHLPILRKGRTLLGHVARPNRHATAFDGKTPALAIFHGPHTYISPNWYSQGGYVPTWNYAAVHVRGRLHRMDDRGRLRTVLERLVERFEADGPEGWRLDSVSEERIDGLINGIVGFEMPIEDIQAKAKMSQDKPDADRNPVIETLEASESPDEQAVAALMRAAAPPERSPGR